MEPEADEALLELVHPGCLRAQAGPEARPGDRSAALAYEVKSD